MGANLILPAGSAAADSTPADPVTRSLRFKDDAYLSFTPSTATSTRQKAVINFWFKLAEPEAGSARYCVFFSAGNVQGSGTEWFGIHYNANTGKLHISDSMGVAAMVATDAVYRDYGAWYNLHLILDSTQSTSTDRLKLYINGELQSLTGTYPTLNQNFKIGTAAPHRFGYQDNPGYHGTTFGPQVYIANAYVLENSTLPFTDFIEDTGFGSYKPKSTSGLTFGNNGFHIDAQPAHDADLLVSSIDRNDGDTDFADAAKGHTLTVSGNTHHDDTVGNPFGSGTAMYFDGTGDNLVVTSDSSFNEFGTGDFTIEMWVNPTDQGSGSFAQMFELYGSSSDRMYLRIERQSSQNVYKFVNVGSNSFDVESDSAPDYGNWQHLAVVRNGTSITMYVDGTAQTDSVTISGSATYNWPSTNLNIGKGSLGGGSADYEGYIFDYRITKGEARYTSNFTAPSAPFELNPVYIGGDQSGNKNHFTATNLASHDVMRDTPTSNFCTFSPISGPPRATTTISEGNLKVVGGFSTYYPRVMGTVAVSSGKWFYEVRCGSNHTSSRDYGFKGVNTLWPTGGYGLAGGSSSWANESEMAFSAYQTGVKFSNSSTPATTGTTWGSDGDIIGLALDLDSSPRTLRVFKNGSEVGSATDIPSGGSTGWVPCIDETSSGPQTSVANFGQDPTFGGLESGTTYTSDNTTGVVGEFYTPIPSGYLPFAAANLDDPTVKPHENFNTKLYSGSYAPSTMAGSTTQAITGVGFQPDIVWIKDRDNASGNYENYNSYYGHYLFDSLRGAGSAFNLDGDVLYGSTYLNSGENGIDSFDTDGFTVDEAEETNFAYDSDYDSTVDGYERYAAWCWKLGQTGSSSTWASGNTNPTSEKYNANAGVSLLRYEDSSYSSGTVTLNHSLGAAPEFAFVGNAYGSYDFPAWHKDLSANNYLSIDSNSSQSSDSSYFPSGCATATTFAVGSSIASGYADLYIYLFNSVDGHSFFGSYIPNGNADGPFIYTGFRPAFVMIKWTGSYGSGQGWSIKDSARDTDNPAQALLHPNDSAAEGTNEPIDLLSNGFKIRGTNHTINSSSSTDKYIFAAFAESPFKYTNAR